MNYIISVKTSFIKLTCLHLLSVGNTYLMNYIMEDCILFTQQSAVCFGQSELSSSVTLFPLGAYRFQDAYAFIFSVSFLQCLSIFAITSFIRFKVGISYYKITFHILWLPFRNSVCLYRFLDNIQTLS